jgi:type I restriction enzyme M protein
MLDSKHSCSPSGRGQGEGKYPRKNEILFIDARNMGHLINRRTRELSHEDIQKIADTYHAWLAADSVGAGFKPAPTTEGSVRAGFKPAPTAPAVYSDIPGFCASIPISRVAELDYVLTPGRYVGLPDEQDDFDFKERFAALKAEFESQLLEEAELNKAIADNLANVKL